MSPVLRTLLLAAALIHSASLVMGQFTDGLDDGNITDDPAWSGDVDLFSVVDESGNFILRSNNPGAATYHLSTPSSTALVAQWEFFVDLRFATSGVNYVDMYLVSPQADLNARPPGYFVRIGDTPDNIVLNKREGTTNTALVQSPTGTVGSSSSNPFRIRVTRDASDTWTLAYQPGGAGPFTTAGVATDNTFNSGTHFGILIVQSTAASAVNNHYFDDFSVGPIPIDEDPPMITGVNVIDVQTIEVLFNEALEQSSAETAGNYTVTPGNTASGAALDPVDPSRVRLSLSAPLTNGTLYTLTVNGVADLAGNFVVNATTEFLYFVSDVPAYRDVVINELMVDPNPPLGLPDAEYIELYNATADKYFDLLGWSVTTSSSEATLASYALAPGQHVLLVSTANHPLFAFVPNSMPFSLSSTALVNGGTTVSLLAPGDVLLDVVSYTLDWYQDPAKDDGGWSLEQINPFNPCSGKENWRASSAVQGGTPGQVNAVLDPTPDTQAPALLQVLLLADTLLELVFSEGMELGSVLGGAYSIDPPLPIEQVSGVPPQNQRVQLLLTTAMEVGVIYTITVDGSTDCSGNPLGALNTGRFAIPDTAAPGDVVVNEVLPNPITTGGEYVEVYNRSDKVLSLQGWQMANESGGAVANPVVITTEPLLFFPGEYFLFTRSTSVTAEQFPSGRTERFVTVDLPSYTNESGSVVVLDPQSTVIDLFRYDEDMQFPLLQSVKGVALERQDPDRPTDDRTNWHSAAEYVGFGTPGFQNSQFAPAPSPTGEMTIDPSIFSPDNDGFQDVLTISFRFDQPGFVGTMRVFDVVGREVRRLMDNQLLGTTGAVSWDGVLDSGSKGRMGAYVIVFEVYDLAGTVEAFKKTVTLAHQLDRNP
jgi:hypothetical protein